MLRPLALIVFAGVLACTGGRRRPAASGPVAAAEARPICAEPSSLRRVSPAEMADILGEDPEKDATWRRSEVDGTIADASVTYAMASDGAITASLYGEPRWTIAARQVAGGAFGLVLSPRGGVVGRVFSRGGLELFNAADGHPLHEVGEAVPSPDDRFVVDVPHVPFAREEWNHTDVRVVPLDGASQPRSLVDLPLKNGDNVAFGATICATGALIAVSFPTTELAIYRASDLQKLASFERPCAGTPTFTRSGHYVVVHAADEAMMFELVP